MDSFISILKLQYLCDHQLVAESLFQSIEQINKIFWYFINLWKKQFTILYIINEQLALQ